MTKQKLFWQPCLSSNVRSEVWAFGVNPDGPHLQRTASGVAVLWRPVFEDGVDGWIGFRSRTDREHALHG